jgi:uncharacterized alpha-E superfamily protein
MLSSLANRAYWVARYLERAENTARLIQAYTNLSLDLPSDLKSDWAKLIEVSGTGDEFRALNYKPLEKNAVRFLCAEKRCPGSILNSIKSARENLRTLREVVPKEAFETVNELYLFANAKLDKAGSRKNRFAILNEVIERCQLITGLLAGTMNQTAAYHFLRLGRNLERGDMTTRILDMGSDLLSQEEQMGAENVISMWVNVLRSLSAYQAYRLSVQSRLTPVRVLYFLLADKDFPRTLTHCLLEAKACAEKLPRSEQVTQSIQNTLDVLNGMSLRGLVRDTLHEDIDRLQLELLKIHDQIATIWFEPHDEQPATSV